MFKQLFILVYRLVRFPKAVWPELGGEKENTEEFNARIFYPLLGLITLTAFVGELVNSTDFSVQIPLKIALISCVSLFGGAHLAAYAIEWFMQKMRGSTQQHARSFLFVGYCYAPVIVVKSFIQLFPDFVFLELIWLIVPYCAWYGIKSFYEIPDSRHLAFTIVLSGISILMPQIIDTMMFLLMPGLRM